MPESYGTKDKCPVDTAKILAESIIFVRFVAYLMKRHKAAFLDVEMEDLDRFQNAVITLNKIEGNRIRFEMHDKGVVVL